MRALRRQRNRAQTVRQTPLGQIVTQIGLHALRRRRARDRASVRIVRGRGAREIETRLTVNVPPGVDDGSRIRIAGNGEGGNAAAGRPAISTST